MENATATTTSPSTATATTATAETTETPYVCTTCQGYLSGLATTTTTKQENENEEEIICSICMGLWSLSTQSSTTSTSTLKLIKAIQKACEPYGGMDASFNVFAKLPNHSPTIAISADVQVRYRYFLLTKSKTTTSKNACPVSIFIQDLKQHLHSVLSNILLNTNNSSSASVSSLLLLPNNKKHLQEKYETEEQGYLSIHLLCIPPKDMIPSLLNNSGDGSNSFNKKRKKSRKQRRPFQTQGGDPRVNLEIRLQTPSNKNNDNHHNDNNNNQYNNNKDNNNDDNNNNGYDWLPLSMADSYSIQSTTATKMAWNTALEFHVAVFRRPIFLYGYYTKCRRDVSQTPFVVTTTTKATTTTTKNTNNNDNSKDENTNDKTTTNNDDEEDIEKDNDIKRNKKPRADSPSEKNETNNNDHMDQDDESNQNNGNGNDNDNNNAERNNDTTPNNETITNITNTKTTTTLGITSVEEQICNPIIKMLGISTQNNINTNNPNNNGGTGGTGSGGVVYGMCKFHASGREDMDVRMVIRTNKNNGNNNNNHNNNSSKGRPFCVQLVDALRPIQTKEQLTTLIHMINHTTTPDIPSDCTTTTTTTTITTTTPIDTTGEEEHKNDNDKTKMITDNNKEQDASNNNNNNNNTKIPTTTTTTTTTTTEYKDPMPRFENDHTTIAWYGKNPMGVGISDHFFLVPSSAFSNLQADTETKVKHYGCYCWSENVLPETTTKDEFNTTTTTNFLPSMIPTLSLPLTIQQKTPIRVLHRRANMIRERQILDAKAYRLDDHYFQLQLTTQAGTYVKEFVHGDLRRTVPSIASIFNCKTNLLLLDCEGIEIEIDSDSNSYGSGGGSGDGDCGDNGEKEKEEDK